MNAQTSAKCPWWLRLAIGCKPRRTLTRILIWAFCLLVFFRFIVMPIQVSGLSMIPTYTDGRITFVNRLAYAWKKPQRGDIVVIKMAKGGLILKRIVGLPGERVKVVMGEVFINGKKLEEPYVQKKGFLFQPEEVVEEDHYFVIGDNRRITYFNLMPAWTIVGKVIR